jgi:hypothetical protein
VVVAASLGELEAGFRALLDDKPELRAAGVRLTLEEAD